MSPYAGSVAGLTNLNIGGEKHETAAVAHHIVVKQHLLVTPGLCLQVRCATVLGASVKNSLARLTTLSAESYVEVCSVSIRTFVGLMHPSSGTNERDSLN